MKSDLYHYIQQCRKRPPKDQIHFSIFILKSQRKRIRFNKIIPSLIGNVNVTGTGAWNITHNYQDQIHLLCQTALNRTRNTNADLTKELDVFSFSMLVNKQELDSTDMFLLY